MPGRGSTRYTCRIHPPRGGSGIRIGAQQADGQRGVVVVGDPTGVDAGVASQGFVIVVDAFPNPPERKALVA